MKLQNSGLLRAGSYALLAANAAGLIAADQASATTEQEPAPAWYNNVYLSLSAGGQSRGPAAESANTWTEWDPGISGNLALGYHLCRYVRAEVEGSMFYNEAETLSAGPGLVAPAEGDAFLRAVMFSLYLQYPIKDTKFTPYFGGGVGFYKSHLRDLSNTTVKPFGFVFDGNSEGERFAYQLRAGLSYALTDHLDLWGGYRYWRGGELDFNFQDVPIGSGQTFAASPKKAEIHGGEIGIRWTF